MSATEVLTNSLVNFINIYLILIFIRLLLSWFQTAEIASQAISFLSPVTDPYLNVFRSFIPPLGGIDLSPILAIIVLNLIASFLTAV
ncbi:YggT family protein [Gloeocapsa sp. PCC 73106]|uniref:YggT family protein n=1 Tax=Gloeocapsa sp. PCC 73106 TaxID=102232 RepID=UPI0002AC3C4A|nr:YggT family protein [Gloeocapsa sp. PCC 73106]ELR99649.1 putative integral membrane protein [Gloeocapsa sp. PCC 73106]